MNNGFGFTPNYNNFQPNNINNPMMNNGYNNNKMGDYLNQFQQPQQQNTNNSKTNADFIIVKSIDEAKDFVVQYGTTMWFRHSSKPEIYVKAVSDVGNPSFIGYTLTPISDDVNSTQTNNDFVRRDEYNILLAELDNMKNSFIQQSNVINQMVQNPVVANKGKTKSSSAKEDK